MLTFSPLSVASISSAVALTFAPLTNSTAVTSVNSLSLNSSVGVSSSTGALSLNSIIPRLRLALTQDSATAAQGIVTFNYGMISQIVYLDGYLASPLNFEYSGWANVNVAITSNQASPSDNAAQLITAVGGLGYHQISQLVSGNTDTRPWTISVAAAYTGGLNSFYLQIYDSDGLNGAACLFNVQNGTIPTTTVFNGAHNPSVLNNSTVISSSIVPLNNGFYQCTLTVEINEPSDGNLQGIFSLASNIDSNPEFVGNGSGIVFWHPQLVQAFNAPPFGFGKITPVTSLSLVGTSSTLSLGGMAAIHLISVAAPGNFEIVSATGKLS